MEVLIRLKNGDTVYASINEAGVIGVAYYYEKDEPMNPPAVIEPSPYEFSRWLDDSVSVRIDFEGEWEKAKVLKTLIDYHGMRYARRGR